MIKISSPWTPEFECWIEIYESDEEVQNSWDNQLKESGYRMKVFLQWPENRAYESATPDNPEFKYFLKRVGEYKPEVYRAVYEHIEGLEKNDPILLGISDYCLEMSEKLVNDYVDNIRITRKRKKD